MNIHFKNATILDPASTNILRSGDLYIKGNKISYNGEGEFERTINLNGNLIIPGFKNAHAHSPMTFLRSFADDMPLDAWLNKQVFPMEDKLRDDDIYHLTNLAILEYLSGGITASFDMYMRPDLMAQSAIDNGFRMVLCGGVNDFGGTAETLNDEYIKFNGISPLISYILGFHAEYTTSLPLMQEISDLANQLKAPVFCHNSETAKEVEDCFGRYGCSPTELFDKIGMFNYGGGGFHCIYFEEKDFEIFKNRGLYAVTCPASNAKLASGIAPLTFFESQGIPIAIGTDGPASNNCLDMFREMFLMTALQKLRTADASAMSGISVLRAAVSTGATAMGLSDCDSLAEGKIADLAIIDLNSPNMQPLNNIPNNLVYSGSKLNVKMTIINGEILYENGEYPGIDKDAVFAKANEIIKSKI